VTLKVGKMWRLRVVAATTWQANMNPSQSLRTIFIVKLGKIL
jgi:hypothetical protein